MNKNLILLGMTTFILLQSCGVTGTWVSKKNKDWKQAFVASDSKLMNRVILIGDAGKPNTDGPDPVLELAKRKLQPDSSERDFAKAKNFSVIYLGDNIYEYGMPDTSDIGRELAEKRMAAQLDVIKGHPGQGIVIPGNHDWNKMRPDGRVTLKRQEDFIAEYLDSNRHFFPKNGCPGPVEVQLGEKLVGIIIDSEWWLYPHDKPYQDCNIQNDYEFILDLRSAIRRNKIKKNNILLLMHHPVKTNSNHGGYYSLLDHIFPLTIKWDNLYIPLPIIGSIYPLARQYGISPEDDAHPRYQALVKEIENMVDDQTQLIIASGHDHNLQLQQFTKDVYSIVSGSGSKSKHVVNEEDAHFVAKENGFAILNYYNNGEVWVEFWKPDPDKPDGTLLFKKPLYSVPVDKNPMISERSIPDYRDSIIAVTLNEDYKTNSKLKRFFFGQVYRDLWSTPVKLKYLDMKTVGKGGIKPIKLGGGKQTTSLRCEDEDGTEYTLRTVNKDATSVLPDGLQETFAADIVQDQISSSHPYGSLAIPKLAKAAGIYHTNPQILYTPYTPSLEEYLDEIGGQVVLMEIRPDEDMSDFKRFGKAKDIVSTQKMFSELTEDNDNKVDSEDFLQARFLDILVGDWDRHEDQWRWAEFENPKGGEIFRAIPRDRDQVFVKFNGVIPRYVTSRSIKRMLTSFDEEIKDIVGLTMQGNPLDRRILSGMEKDDWMRIATKFQAAMTDEIIVEAINSMPIEAVELTGQEMIDKLKIRRDDFLKYAEDWYKFLAEEISVVLSNKDEWVLLDRKENGDVNLKVYKRDFDPGKKDEIDQKIFERKILYAETDALNIFCMAGRDSVQVIGEGKKGLKVRIIGGAGVDYVSDSSKIQGWGKNTIYYDDSRVIEPNNFIKSGEIRSKQSADASINEYYLRHYNYNVLRFLPSATYDRDFGFFLGGSMTYRRHGFRSLPYKAQYQAKFQRSTATEATNFKVSADYPVLFNKKLGLMLISDYQGPNYVRNYFGQSNESVFENRDITLYRIGLNYFTQNIWFKWRASRIHTFELGPRYNFGTLERNGKIAPNSAFANIESDDAKYEFIGGGIKHLLDLTNNLRLPTRGFSVQTSVDYFNSINNSKYEFTQYSSELRFYLTPAKWRVKNTFAFRLGGQTTSGDFPFFKSANLSGAENIRGFRRDRFSGRSAVYLNNESRIRLGKVSNSLIAGDFGFIAFYDIARVYADNEISQKWHIGYGGGAYIDVFQMFVMSAHIGFTDEGFNARIGGGFFF